MAYLNNNNGELLFSASKIREKIFSSLYYSDLACKSAFMAKNVGELKRMKVYIRGD